MLPASHRMRRRGDFQAAVRQGRRAGQPSVVVHLTQTGTGDPARVGFVVSRSVGGAVVRNRVKRRLRHLTSDRLDVLPSGSLVVVRANPTAAQRTHTELAGDLERGLRRVLREVERRT